MANLLVNGESVKVSEGFVHYSDTVRELLESVEDKENVEVPILLGCEIKKEGDKLVNKQVSNEVTEADIRKIEKWCDQYKDTPNERIYGFVPNLEHEGKVVRGDNHLERYDESLIQDVREQLNNEWNKEWFESDLKYKLDDPAPLPQVYLSKNDEKKQSIKKARELYAHLAHIRKIVDYLNMNILFILCDKKCQHLITEHCDKSYEPKELAEIMRYIMNEPDDIPEDVKDEIIQEIKEKKFVKRY